MRKLRREANLSDKAQPVFDHKPSQADARNHTYLIL